ncbi:hypothetical protein A9Q87_06825 [Flavobacteriales bacterium 34_180_T64]|nr:hypothetical protein A9Q87_06825 [Flavobacteriales bacterium 34_180_T64]
MEFLLKSSAIIVIFYCCYKLFLQNETFFESNRWFLLAGLITSVIIPFVVIPIYIEYTPQPLHDIVFSTSNEGITSVSNDNIFTVFTALNLIYICGVIFFFGKLCIEFISLLLLIKKHQPVKKGRYSYIETRAEVAPFSFFKWIIYNPKQFQKNELEHIIAHEKVHAMQFHSLDVIINQFLCIVFWFNPFIWFYKKDVQQNLEFIADQNAQQVSECDKSYQLVLLKSSIPKHQYILSNNFYNSLIKKRIIMLHKSKSNKLNSLKYILIIPILALFLMSFNTKEIFVEKEIPLSENKIIEDVSFGEELNEVYDEIADSKSETTIKKESNQTKQASKTSVTPSIRNSQEAKSVSTIVAQKTTKVLQFGDGNIEMTLITKDFTDADFEKIKKEFKSKGITVKFKSIKRNKNGEITAIKIDVDSKKSNANYSISTDKAISPIKITFGDNGNNISIGNAHMVHSGDNDFLFKTKDGKHTVHRSGSGNNVYVISDDDDEHEHEHEHDGKAHEEKIIIKRNGKHENIIRSKNVHVISGDDNKKVEIIIDGENELHEDNDNNVLILKSNGTTWTHDENNNITLKSIGKNKSIFLTGEDHENTLFFLDGKEISSKDLEKLDTDTVDKIEVLKGDKATEKYGKKAKDGVVLITTKKKN